MSLQPDAFGLHVPEEPRWPWEHVRPWVVNYRAWDGHTARKAVIVLPRDWGPDHHPVRLPLVISPHGRNTFGWNNALGYWRNLPAAGPFALVCPDGLGRARDAATDPFDRPPDPSLFTYGNRGQIDDLARMPNIVRGALPWLKLDPKRVFVLGGSMGGEETLLLAARHPHILQGGYGRLAGAAAFDSPCDMAKQCGYLTHVRPAVAARMIEEIGTRPASVRGWNRDAAFHNQKNGRQETIGSLLAELPKGQGAWDERSPLHHAQALASLPFPLRLYWSTEDVVVGNQERDQSGKLYKRIKQLNPHASVTAVRGTWVHSHEFVPTGQLGPALRDLGLIEQV